MRRTAVYTLDVTITEVPMAGGPVRDEPGVSRRIEIRGDQTLNRLHWAIFGAFERSDDCHLHEFHLGERPRDRHARRYVLPIVLDDPDGSGTPRPAGTVTRTRLYHLGLGVGGVFWYWFDLGDGWYHRIDVIAIDEPRQGVKYPRVIARAGEGPTLHPARNGTGCEERDERPTLYPPTNGPEGDHGDD